VARKTNWTVLFLAIVAGLVLLALTVLFRIPSHPKDGTSGA
jgi:hypothetical protein